MTKLICIEEKTFDLLKERIASLAQLAQRLQRIEERPAPDEWIASDEVCRRLAVTKQTLQAYRRKGLLPFSTVEGKVLFRQGDIADFLERRTVEPE